MKRPRFQAPPPSLTVRCMSPDDCVPRQRMRFQTSPNATASQAQAISMKDKSPENAVFHQQQHQRPRFAASDDADDSIVRGLPDPRQFRAGDAYTSHPQSNEEGMDLEDDDYGDGRSGGGAVGRTPESKICVLLLNVNRSLSFLVCSCR